MTDIIARLLIAISVISGIVYTSALAPANAAGGLGVQVR